MLNHLMASEFMRNEKYTETEKTALSTYTKLMRGAP